MGASNETEKVQLHLIEMDHLSHVVKLIAERNNIIHHYRKTPPEHLHESNNVLRQVEWYNDNIKKCLGI